MFKIYIINTGYIKADGGAMFGVIPKRAWQRKYPCDNNNLCPLAMRCILAISDDKKILIDMGVGDIYTRDISYYEPFDLVTIHQSLSVLGFHADDITDVVMTHLHFDHCGGGVVRDDNNEIVPAFAKAKYWLSKNQWDNCLNPSRLEADSIFGDTIRPIKEAGLLNLIAEDMDLYPGFSLRMFDGHTVGQIVPLIETKEGVVAFPGDLIPTSNHVSLEWISAYDLLAQTSLTEKERLLTEAVEREYTLVYYHDALVQSSKVKRMNDNFRAVEMQKTDFDLLKAPEGSFRSIR